jgi:hypothetical protein
MLHTEVHVRNPYRAIIHNDFLDLFTNLFTVL